MIAAAAEATSDTKEPVVPSMMISDMEPRSKAITGVPHAMASTTESPNGSSKSIK